MGCERTACGRIRPMGADPLFLRDACLRSFTAEVVAVDGLRVALDRTAFYPTGGGQPHDTGTLGAARVAEVRNEGDEVSFLRRIRIVETESKGKGSNKRIRLEVADADG